MKLKFLLLMMILLVPAQVFAVPMQYEEVLPLNIILADFQDPNGELPRTGNVPFFMGIFPGINTTGFDLISADLCITHAGNTRLDEEWLVAGIGETGPELMGFLSESPSFVTDTFSISSSLLSSMESLDWAFGLLIDEPTTGLDSVFISEVRMIWTYDMEAPAAVPEGATIILLGTGLIGIGLFKPKVKSQRLVS